jgi:hypothetical protein
MAGERHGHGMLCVNRPYEVDCGNDLCGVDVRFTASTVQDMTGSVIEKLSGSESCSLHTKPVIYWYFSIAPVAETL